MKAHNLISSSSSNSSGCTQMKVRGAAAHGAGIGNPRRAEQHLFSYMSQLLA